MANPNTGMKNQFVMGILWRWMGMMLLVYTVVELFFLSHSHVPPKAYLLALGATTILAGHILYPANALTIIASALRPALWSALLAGGVLLLMLLQLMLHPHHYPDIWQLVRLSIGVFVLSLVLCSVTRIACVFFEDTGRATSTILMLCVLVTATPLWLGPFTEHLIESQALTNTVISVSPLTYLAVLTDYDYLRSSWFYSHTPFGELRYTYPSALALTAFYMLLCAALPVFRKAREWQKRHRGPYLITKKNAN